ncbi:copper resistance protein B [Solilutibacter pythonis]|nr:copper resistance protein B [Lysobacter pythonis]
MKPILVTALAAVSLPSPAQHSGHAPVPRAPQSMPTTRAEVPKSPDKKPLPDFIPAVTRKEIDDAFPNLDGMDMSSHMREDPWLTSVRFDRLERGLQRDAAASWEIHAWTGKSRDRLWLRSHGERQAHGVHGNVELMWGHATGPWWDRMIGLRRDFAGGERRDWVGLGVHGHASYKFDVDATAYLGNEGRASFEGKIGYEALLTNRLILQPELGLSIHTKDDARMRIGRRLSNMHGGLRLRYEFTRELAPYFGWRWSRTYGRTAELRREHGEPVTERGWVVGIRFWF